MRLRNLAPALSVLAAALLASCDGNPSGADSTPSVSFSYSGTVTGQFSVTAPRPPAGPRTAPYVEGLIIGPNQFTVSSFSMAGGGITDAVIIEGPSEPGSYGIGAAGPCAGFSLCPNVHGGFEQAVGATPRQGERGFYLSQGTLIIEPSRGDGRIRGRFSGTAVVSRYDSGWHPDGTIQITNGRFEADVVG